MPYYKMAFAKNAVKKRAKKSNVGTAKKALRKVNALARTLKPEVKFVDFRLPATEFGTNGEIFDLTRIVSIGDNNVTRDGRKIRALRLTGIMQMELAEGKPSSAFRFIIFRGNMNDGKEYHIGSSTSGSAKIPILNDTDLYPLVSRKVDDQSKMSRFIYDKTYALDIGNIRLLTKKINFKLGWEVQFKSTPAEAAPIAQDGGLYIAGMNNAEEEMTTSMNFRLWYTDV